MPKKVKLLDAADARQLAEENSYKAFSEDIAVNISRHAALGDVQYRVTLREDWSHVTVKALEKVIRELLAKNYKICLYDYCLENPAQTRVKIDRLFVNNLFDFAFEECHSYLLEISW